jgi:hypothetical protein
VFPSYIPLSWARRLSSQAELTARPKGLQQGSSETMASLVVG